MAFLVRGMLLVIALGFALVLAPVILLRAFPVEPLDRASLQMMGNRVNWEAPHPYLSNLRYQRSVRDLHQVQARNQGLNRTFNEGLPPEIDRAGKYIVAIGGNSVAQQIASEPTYLRILAESIGKLPEARGKIVEFVNLTQDGFKQPQPAIAVLLFHSYFDAYLSLEGFNEAIYALDHTHLPSHYPMAHLVVPAGREYALHGWLLLRAIYVRFVNLSAPILFAPLKELAAKGMRAILSRWAKIIIGYSSPPSEAEWPVPASKVWENSLISQAAILKEFGKKHWVFLQPNLHLEGSKVLSEAEISFQSNGRALKPLLDQNYQKFRALFPQLRRRGVTIFDLTQMFSRTPETVYGDSCCHFNSFGLTKLAEKMGSEILEREKKR